jgi:hypothetical protein
MFTLDSQHYIEGIDTYDETKMAKDLLQEASSHLCSEIETLNKIKYIANTRFALSVVAKYIHNMYGTTQRKIRSGRFNLGLQLWMFSHFQQYISYHEGVSIIGGGYHLLIYLNI